MGYTEVNGKCYNDIDMEVLKEFSNLNSFVDPLEISDQKWNKNGRLTKLWLRYDTLNRIPENIGDLTYLDTLDLGYTHITGEIPESIGNLEKLDWLYLYYNQLSGVIPDSICNIFPNLSNFWIQFNSLCPPYPECIPENYIDPQNTSQCP